MKSGDLCGMPITKESTPWPLDTSMMCLRAGINTLSLNNIKITMVIIKHAHLTPLQPKSFLTWPLLC